MNPDIPNTPPSPPPAASATTAVGAAPVVVPPQPGSNRHPVSWLSLLALLVAALALVFAGLLWQKLGFTQQELARRSQDSATQAIEVRTVANQAEALTQELQARLAVAEVKLSEVTLQRSQLEELMLALSRSRDDNLVQDIESALRLGLQQAQLTGSAQPLVSALQAADQRIARAAQPRLNPVQRAIQRDIERIQGAALTDVPTLVMRVDELARQVDVWPVQNDVGTKAIPAKAVAPIEPEPVAVPPAEPASDAGADGAVPASETAAAPAEGAAPSGWTRVSDGWSAFWRHVWTDVTRSGRELVRVSRIDHPEAALLAPEQAFFLRENLKLRLLNARLGLLGRQLDAVKADLVATEKALGRYFDTRSPQVAAAQKTLAQLRTELALVDLPRPDESLAALAVAAGGR